MLLCVCVVFQSIDDCVGVDDVVVLVKGVVEIEECVADFGRFEGGECEHGSSVGVHVSFFILIVINRTG